MAEIFCANILYVPSAILSVSDCCCMFTVDCSSGVGAPAPVKYMVLNIRHKCTNASQLTCKLVMKV